MNNDIGNCRTEEPASKQSAEDSVGPKRCIECRIALTPAQSTKERAETERPGLCDCCRSMIEAIGHPQVKDFFINAHLEWDSENDRRIGLIRGKV